MEITKYLTSIIVISILSNNVKCGFERLDGTTMTKIGGMKTALSEAKAAAEKTKQGTSIRITIMKVIQNIMFQVLRFTLIKFRLV